IGALALRDATAELERAVRAGQESERLAPLIDTSAVELAAVVATITQAFALERPTPVVVAKEGAESEAEARMDPVQAKPLFRRARALLYHFDSDAEAVIRELEGLLRNEHERECLRQMRQRLEGYDYEGSLEMLDQWAGEMGMELEG
ncbi:MAG: hypothetical protein HQL97_05520, partial [Magnetococcales bacterium]|nr:hypothetical protein [Magnetococcales bacterium]